MLLSIVCVCICVSLGYVLLCRRYIPPVNYLVPKQPGWLPIVGHLHGFLGRTEIFDIIISWYKFSFEQGDVTSVFFGPYPVYIITDPENAVTVLQKCLDKQFLYKLIEPLLGKMLVAAKVPIWKRSRRLVYQSFKQVILEDYTEVFLEHADRLAEAMDKYVGEGEVDVSEAITKSFIETTCYTTLGLRVAEKDVAYDKLALAMDTFMDILMIKFCKPWLFLDPIFNISTYRKKMEDCLEMFSSTINKMVDLRMEDLQRLKNKSNYEDNGFKSFLDVLIETSGMEKASTFTDAEMRDLVVNILGASFDTTISEMILVLVCLGTYSKVQEKIYQEIMNVLGETGKVTKKNLPLLVYLEAVIKETLRLYPIALVLGRDASTDVKLRNTTIPAGSSVLVHMWALNRHPKYWGEDADEFKPERWLDDSVPKHPAAFATFALGRRGCPGKQYTLTLFKTTLVPLIKKFKFTADSKNLKLESKVLVRIHSGHHIKIEYR